VAAAGAGESAPANVREEEAVEEEAVEADPGVSGRSVVLPVPSVSIVEVMEVLAVVWCGSVVDVATMVGPKAIRSQNAGGGSAVPSLRPLIDAVGAIGRCRC
jgi:hypothetical protein